MVLSRLVQAVPSLLGVTIIAFVLLHLSGDVTQLLLPMEASEEVRADFRRAYGLDQPIPVQYAHYLARLLQGDFGQSFAYRRPAMEVVLERQSVPTFWLGMLMILVFAVVLHALPVSGRGSFAQLVLPSVTLAMWLLALVARLTRSGMLEVLSQDYIRTARAKGLAEVAVTTRHAVRNALVPIVTVVGLQVGGLLGGAVMTEAVFAWPGVGTLVLESILKRDYP